jgi:hypothetical protein
MKNRIVIFLLALVVMTLACTLLSPGNPDPTLQVPGGETPVGTSPSPIGTPESQPVRISDGLASLNSYRITITFISRGPTPEDSSTIVIETQRSQEQDARYTHMTQATVKKGVEASSNQVTELYRIGNDQCSNQDGEWSWTSMAPNQAEMIDLMMNMFDFTPIIDFPNFVAQEEVNGIPSNHFSFSVAGLGVESGAEVTINQGDYWLAVDGQYIIKYSLILETVVDPQTNIIHMETFIDMNDINQPVNIVFPQACLDAALVTPEP